MLQQCCGTVCPAVALAVGLYIIVFASAAITQPAYPLTVTDLNTEGFGGPGGAAYASNPVPILSLSSPPAAGGGGGGAGAGAGAPVSLSAGALAASTSGLADLLDYSAAVQSRVASSAGTTAPVDRQTNRQPDRQTDR
jgi:hypothetical protein